MRLRKGESRQSWHWDFPALEVSQLANWHVGLQVNMPGKPVVREGARHRIIQCVIAWDFGAGESEN